MNPFTPKHPADPNHFVNRTEILKKFQQMLENSAENKPPRPDNIALLGQWGLGKSSLLHKFEKFCLEQKEIKVFTALIELNPQSCTSLEKFAARTRDEIERTFKVSDIPLLAKLKKEWIPGWRLKTIDLGITTIEKERKDISPITAFEDSLRELWDILAKNNVDVALLMFDDLNYMAQLYPNGLYDIRTIFQGLPRDGCNFMLAITGAPYLFFMAREFAEPFTRFFDRFYLEHFDLKETKNFILKPIKHSKLGINISDPVLNRIFDLTQGHPYFLSFIAADLINLTESKNIDMRNFNKIYPAIFKNLAHDKFNGDFEHAGDREKDILLKIASLNEKMVSANQIKIKNMGKFIKNLTENKGLLIRTSRGEYSLYHPLFKEYLRQFKLKTGHTL